MRRASVEFSTATKSEWSWCIPPPQWEIYDQVIQGAQALEISFALGGAFALASHTGAWRNTKDLDLYVLPNESRRMIALLESLGLADYYQKVPYDRWWIYRGYKDETIVDVIWAMANHRAQIDELWLSGPPVEIHGRRVPVVPAEAMLWDKLYIMQRDRCDWPDALNLLYARGRDLNWEYLLGRIGEDWPLLAGVLEVFRWCSPGNAQMLPEWIWERLQLPKSPKEQMPEVDRRRVALLDTRPWFGEDRRSQQPAASGRAGEC